MKSASSHHQQHAVLIESGPSATLKTTTSLSKRERTVYRKLNLLFVLYWAVAAMMAAWWFLGSKGSSSRRNNQSISSLRLPNSRFVCRGDETATRQCVFYNVIVKEGAIWLYNNDPQVKVPTMLCSTANLPSPYVHECHVHVVSHAPTFVELLRDTSHTPRFDFAVALSRLNPNNAYHAIFEDMIPATAMMRRVGNVSADPAETLRSLQQKRWGLFLMDGHGGGPLDKHFWQTYLPEIAIMQHSGLAYRVNKLIAGTQASCAHWGHCQPLDRPTGLFDPPDAAVALRRLVFRRYGIEEEEKEEEDGNDTSTFRQGPPQVTLVQRSSTRIIQNLDEVVEKLTSVLGVPPRVVDMAHLSVLEQLTVAHNTDIYVLIHGGALANLLWLPPRALVIDIYPHEFLIPHHSGIIHWIRKSLEPAFNLGHHPFQVDTAEGQELLSGPMVPGCVCYDSACQAKVFATSAKITVPAERFEAHLMEGLRLWQGGKYDEPITPAEFIKRQVKSDRERALPGSGAPACQGDVQRR